ncbi:hypothetical protein D3C71_1456900 [compost metagenome]
MTGGDAGATGVVTVLVHAPLVLQLRSPPSNAVAVLVTSGTAEGRGVTGMTKDTDDVSPAGTRQPMFWPIRLHHGGSSPMVSEGGTLSSTSASPVVSTPFVLVSVSV